MSLQQAADFTHRQMKGERERDLLSVETKILYRQQEDVS